MKAEWLSRQELRIRLGAVLASAGAAEALLTRMRAAVRGQGAELDGEGSGIGLTGPKLALFVLSRPGPDEPEHAVILMVRGELNNIVRPSREGWRIRTSTERDRKLDELRPLLNKRMAVAADRLEPPILVASDWGRTREWRRSGARRLGQSSRGTPPTSHNGAGRQTPEAVAHDIGPPAARTQVPRRPLWLITMWSLS